MTTIVKVSCFPNEGTPEVIAGEPQAGDLVRITTSGGAVIYERYTPPAAPPSPTPRVLSKTAFQDYAVTQLGGGTTGMARFTEIMDATRTSESGAVRFAFSRYEAADKFEKTNTATLTAIMAADTATVGHITDDERDAILENWP
jgi:hypothetical protein